MTTQVSWQDIRPQSWQDINAEVTRVFTCTHPSPVLVYKDTADGRRTYREQCPICGHGGHALKKASLSETDRAQAQAHDDSIRTRWWEAKETYRRNLTGVAKEGEQRAFWNWYSEYLESDAWRAKRARVLRRSGGLCEGCLTEPAEQVHHLTYERAGDELLFDLVAVCGSCHQRAHPHKKINNFSGVA